MHSPWRSLIRCVEVRLGANQITISPHPHRWGQRIATPIDRGPLNEQSILPPRLADVRAIDLRTRDTRQLPNTIRKSSNFRSHRHEPRRTLAITITITITPSPYPTSPQSI
ncbi:hypothetical protein ACFQ9X_14820 [Catenulispora yoronensis]